MPGSEPRFDGLGVTPTSYRAGALIMLVIGPLVGYHSVCCGNRPCIIGACNRRTLAHHRGLQQTASAACAMAVAAGVTPAVR